MFDPQSDAPLPRGMFWTTDSKGVRRVALTADYQERLQLANLVRVTAPGCRMHERAKARLAVLTPSLAQ